jgi:hypothetical protein
MTLQKETEKKEIETASDRLVHATQKILSALLLLVISVSIKTKVT